MFALIRKYLHLRQKSNTFNCKYFSLSMKYALTRSTEKLLKNAAHLKQYKAVLEICPHRHTIGAKLLAMRC